MKTHTRSVVFLLLFIGVFAISAPRAFASSQFYGHVTGTRGSTAIQMDTRPNNSSTIYYCTSYPNTIYGTGGTCGGGWQSVPTGTLPAIGVGGASITGSYYIYFSDTAQTTYNASHDIGYAVWTYNSVNTSWTTATDPRITQSYITQINTPSSFSTVTSPVTVDFNYRIISGNTFDSYTFTATNIFDGRVYQIQGALPATTTTINNATTSLTIPDNGTYKLSGYLFQKTNISNTSVTNSDVTFLIGAAGYTYQELQNSYQTFASTSCNINFLGSFNAGDCFGLIFTPSSTTLAKFSTLSLNGKIPFSYLTEMQGLYNEMFNASQIGSSSIAVGTPIGTITFISKAQLAAIPLANTIKLIIGYLLWFMFAQLCYYQVLRSHDKKTV